MHVNIYRFLLILSALSFTQLTISALEPKVFIENLRQPTPLWMTEQIQHDLAPFKEELSKEYLDEYFNKYSELLYLVRVRISQGQLSVQKSQAAASYEMSDLILTPLMKMHDLAPLPDLDFIFTCYDQFYTAPLSIRNIDFTTVKWPLFVIAKKKTHGGFILMPDWYALGEFNPDKAKILAGRELMRARWAHKHRKVFFRGADSGVFDRVNWKTCSRPKLVLLSLLRPDLIDAKFSYLLTYEDNSSIRDAMISEGMLGNYVPIEQSVNYRYLIDVDGHTANTPRTALYLYSGSVLFKQVTDNILWFYKQLQPYVHYIPVKEDLSDLVFQIQWAKKHDRECQKIADNAYVLAEDVLRPESVYLYFYRLLEAYSLLQHSFYDKSYAHIKISQ